MNTREILKGWLKEHMYDGLFNAEVPCACGVDNLVPCGDWCPECEAGYSAPCDGTCEQADCDGKHIVRVKPEGGR